MNVTGVQLDIAWEDKAATFARARRLLDAAPPNAGSLVVLPEMFSTGFSMNVAGIQEGSKRLAEGFLETLAREYDCTVLGGVVNLGPDGRGRNQALVVSPQGKEIVRYDKIHPFKEEGDHYTPGRSVQLFDWNGVKVAPFVCYDLRFPEIFRAAAKQGAQMIVVIASWPSYRAHHWTTLLQARAIENLAYVVGVNRCGKDPNHPYPGRSMIVDPQGNVLANAGAEEGLVTASIEPTVVDTWRREFPALRDMRY
jgi:omega-amidase